MKFPTQGTVFDYYIDNETKKFEPWTKKVPKFELDPDVPLQVCNTCVYNNSSQTIIHHLLADLSILNQVQ